MTIHTLAEQYHRLKRASRRGAFFIGVHFALTASAYFFPTPALALGQALECPTDRVDERVNVSQVVDGDTLRLEDGRLVRLIGINTPEIGRDGRPSEPLAEEAKQALKRMLLDKQRVNLRLGVEKKDRHGRTLAHVFLENGQNVEAVLLTAGLGAQIVVPPNVWNLECYRDAEFQARQSNQGVWGSFYQPIPVNRLPRDTRGFRIISGKVVRVGESKRSVWLNFPRRPGEGRREGVAVRISRKDLEYFKQWHPRELKNKQVHVRGWFYSYKKQLVMRVSHPAVIEIVPTNN